jgi:hypothetical protein
MPPFFLLRLLFHDDRHDAIVPAVAIAEGKRAHVGNSFPNDGGSIRIVGRIEDLNHGSAKDLDRGDVAFKVSG